jgi:hypothetical protein
MIEQALEKLVMPLDQSGGHWIIAIRWEGANAPLISWKTHSHLPKPAIIDCVKFICACAGKT